MKFILSFITLSLLSACQQSTDSCYPSEGIPESSATVDYDGSTIDFTSSWMKTGSTLQINLEGADIDSMVTIRLLQSNDGSSTDSLEAEFPYQYSLGNPENATATFYPPSNDGTSATAQTENPGNFTLASFDEEGLTGCFSFTAIDQQGNSYELTLGLINASKNDLSQ